MTSRPLLILICGCTLAGPVAAGGLDAPAAPTAPDSAMYTLEDLYNRLNAGTAGTPRLGAFVEPAAGPGGTMHTLTQIMNLMPAVNANGATPAEVLSGKTFWGLTSGASWGIQTGTATAGTDVVGANGQLVMTIPNGLYAGNKTATASDTSLMASNIKSGISIFGVAGTYTGSGTTFSAPFPVARTGQTIPYTGGDDGVLQKGATWPSPRFTANGNGTVTDNLTGLLWLEDANCANTAMNWPNTLSWVATLKGDNTMCAHIPLNDGSVAGQWRLPNIKELSSLVNAGAGNPALPTSHPFTAVSSSSYWSYTTRSPATNDAWFVDFNAGGVAWSDKETTVSYYMWPVRGGQ